MKKMRYKYDLFFKIEDSLYLGATVSFLPEKIELFYHWTCKNRVLMNSCKNGVITAEYFPDHLSFHKDGTIHLTTKDSKKIKIHNTLQKVETNLFNVQRGRFLPIFLESIDLTSTLAIEHRFKKVDNATSRYVFDVTNLNAFSIILVVKCERINPSLLLQGHGFEKLTYIQSPIWADLFTAEEKTNVFPESSGFDSQLMILVVENVWHEFNQLKHLTNFDITKHRNKLTWITMPPMEKISDMVIYP